MPWKKTAKTMLSENLHFSRFSECWALIIVFGRWTLLDRSTLLDRVVDSARSNRTFLPCMCIADWKGGFVYDSMVSLCFIINLII